MFITIDFNNKYVAFDQNLPHQKKSLLGKVGGFLGKTANKIGDKVKELGITDKAKNVADKGKDLIVIIYFYNRPPVVRI
jgi:hypothetical protein